MSCCVRASSPQNGRRALLKPQPVTNTLFPCATQPPARTAHATLPHILGGRHQGGRIKRPPCPHQSPQTVETRVTLPLNTPKHAHAHMLGPSRRQNLSSKAMAAVPRTVMHPSVPPQQLVACTAGLPTSLDPKLQKHTCSTWTRKTVQAQATTHAKQILITKLNPKVTTDRHTDRRPALLCGASHQHPSHTTKPPKLLSAQQGSRPCTPHPLTRHVVHACPRQPQPQLCLQA